MNHLFQRLMRKATELTRSASLQEATRAIQRALGGEMPKAPEHPFHPDAAPPRAANEDTLVVDVAARFVEPQPVEAEAPPVEAEIGTEQWIDGVFAHDHRSIAYKLFVPAKGAGTPRPLLLMLHGCTQNPEDFAAGTQMNRLAREQGFLVLYPAQTQHANSSKCWNWFKPQHQQRGRGEPALLAALTQFVMAEQSADLARVYVAGLSAGGAMADILGRSYPDLFAAVGVHSGLPSGAASDLMSALSAMKRGGTPQTTAQTVPAIVFHGEADTTVHARNGEQVAAAALAGQPGSAAQPRVASGQSAHGRSFTRRIYTDADGRPTVEHWLLHGAGHAWAGGSPQGSFTDPTGPDASAEMLRFFLAHSNPPGAGGH